MTIYADIVFLENVLMNYIILYTCSKTFKITTNNIRLFISSIIGAVCTLVLLLMMHTTYSDIIIKLIISFAIVKIAFKSHSLVQMLKQIAQFYLISFIYGSLSLGFIYLMNPKSITIKNGNFVGYYPYFMVALSAIVGIILTKQGIFKIINKIKKTDMFCNIEIEFNKKKINIPAMIDTGNLLKDPLTKSDVVIVEKEKLEKLLPNEILEKIDVEKSSDELINLLEDEKYMTRFRIIPFSSLGKKSGILLGFKPDKVKIINDNKKEDKNNVIIGIYQNTLSNKNQYSALVGVDLIL